MCMKKFMHLYRWLKQAGVYIGSEGKQHAPFSFKLPDGGEELRGAAYGYTPSLIQKIKQLLEQNERSVHMTNKM